MDSSQNRDIAMRQNLLYVGGKSTLPPPHIVQQQRTLSHHDFASKTRLLISASHKERCPLCRHRCFIFHQPRFCPHSRTNDSEAVDNHHHHHTQNTLPNDADINMVDTGTFFCAHCCNLAIQGKLSHIRQLRRDIEQYSRRIEPILHQKLHQTLTTYRDKIVQYKQHQQHMANLRTAIQRQQQENASLNAAMDGLRHETQRRHNNLQQLSPKMGHKWQYALHEYSRKISLYENKQTSAQQTSTHQSLKLVLELADFFKIKVLPSMQMNGVTDGEHCKLSMIQNIAIPSVFKIRHIQSFYKDDKHELFRFPVPLRKPTHIHTMDAAFIVPSQSQSPITAATKAQHPSSMSSLHRYARISLKPTTRQAQRSSAQSPPGKIINSLTSSPLQKYIPRLTNSISSFLTPPGLKQRRLNGTYGQACTESRSLPKNLDDLVLPPTFFNDDDSSMMAKEDSPDTQSQPVQSKSESLQTNISTIVRGRSQSLDTLKTTNTRSTKRLIHEPHIEHGICAALHYIVSFVMHASKYLNIQLLYKMGLYRKNKRNQFKMHTWIERKGRYYRLYWIDTDHTLHEEKDEQNGGGNNILEFQHALHLLEENINDLCLKCGVHFIKLYPFQFIDNLNTLLQHLRRNVTEQLMDDNSVQRKKTVHSRHSHSHNQSHGHKNHRDRWKDYKPSYKKIEPLNIIANYDGGLPDDGDHEAKSNQRHTQLSTTMLREKSASNSSSLSGSGSITAVNNSESDIVITPPGQSDHEDWDFVDLTS